MKERLLYVLVKCSKSSFRNFEKNFIGAWHPTLPSILVPPRNAGDFGGQVLHMFWCSSHDGDEHGRFLPLSIKCFVGAHAIKMHTIPSLA